MKLRLLIICLLLTLVSCGSRKNKFVEEVAFLETENVTLNKETETVLTETKTEKRIENETQYTNESRIANESFSATEFTRTFADGSTETYKNPSWNSNNSTTNNNQTTRDYSEEITADLTSTINHKIDSLGQLIRKEDVRIEDESENRLPSFAFYLMIIAFVLFFYFEGDKVINWFIRLWKLIFK